MRLISLSLLITLGLTASSCSISNSVSTASNSVASISDSSVSSDSSDFANQNYRNDLSHFTIAAVRSDKPAEDFLRGVSRIAETFGITHWERDKATYSAIGAGLRQAGVAATGVNQIGFIKALTQEDSGALDAILAGYQS